MFKNFTIKKQYYCLVCFKNLLEISTFQSLSFFHPTLCETCFKKLEVANFQMEFHHYSIQILFYYNDFLKSLIYQFKGCYDIALAPIFLDYHLKQLKQKYKGYVIVYPPSYEKENQKRGFQHVKEMVKTLNLPIYDIFYKNKDYKQSSTPFSLRKNIQSIIEFKNTKVLENQKILLVDDIFTSGHTIQTCILLLKKHVQNMKDLKILCICKTEKKVEF